MITQQSRRGADTQLMHALAAEDTQVSEKVEHSPAATHRIDERSSHDDEAARGLGNKVRDAGSQMAGHATELLKEVATRGALRSWASHDQAVSATHTAKDGISDRLMT